MSEKTLSKYAVVFNYCSQHWTKDGDYNLMFIKRQEMYCNELLKSRKYLFLRDVYEMLGIQVTKESCLVGWIFEENNQDGDNFVKFNIVEYVIPDIILDFNVDGCIINRL